MKPEQQKALREPFPPASIGKLPKGGAMLDYVGHAAVCDRLLAVDPAWFWEPLAFDEQGLPRYDVKGGLWIRLTVLDVTRLGYGDGPDPKQRIGDAIRNAAMRFGVALDLWAKEDITATTHVDAIPSDDTRPAERSTTTRGEDDPWATTTPGPFINEPGSAPTKQQLGMLGALLQGQTRDQALAIVSSILGREVASRTELTKGEASFVIDGLKAYKDGVTE